MHTGHNRWGKEWAGGAGDKVGGGRVLREGQRLCIPGVPGGGTEAVEGRGKRGQQLCIPDTAGGGKGGKELT